MLALIIVLVVVAVALLAAGGQLVLRRRRRGIELEPPRRPGGRAPVSSPPARRSPPAPSVERAPPAPSPAVEDRGPAGPEPEEPAPAGPTTVDQPARDLDATAVEEVAEEHEEAEDEVEVPPRFRDRLGRARALFSGYFGDVRSRGKVDQGTWDELEEALIRADVGVETTMAVLDDLRAQVKQERITTPDEVLVALKEDLVGRLAGDRTLAFGEGAANIWLFVGVNGVGKTTTISKVARHQRHEGRSVIMAAGDTFRAAAADQLQMWAERSGADLVRGSEGGDPASVVFDAVERAGARSIDLVLADTAGRLHTKVNLMEELKKLRRVAERPPGQLREVLLVMDATTGQNGLIQAKEFTAAVGVTGVVLTKLDGTAKGGIAVAIETELGIPIKLVGLGEGPEDLVEFDPVEFVDALFED